MDPAAPAQAKPAGTLEKAAAALNPLSSPGEEMKASMDKFLKATSFHAVMDMQGARSMVIEMDFVAPDRYRMNLPARRPGQHRRPAGRDLGAGTQTARGRIASRP